MTQTTRLLGKAASALRDLATFAPVTKSAIAELVNIAAELVALENSMLSPWISVADRLPDITESYPDRSVPVLARTADGTRRVARYERDYDYGKSRWIEEGRDSYWLDEVVDWMPLP